MAGETPVFSSIFTLSAGAYRSASIRYRLLKPISSLSPSPLTRHTSLASPLPVLADSITLSWSNKQRTGLFSLSEITTDTRSMLSMRALVSATI